MNENPEVSVLTARRAPQHVRLFSADDAYEHLCILTMLPSLASLHLMLADTPWPHGFGATLANVGPLSEGFERSVVSPLQPRRLRATGRSPAASASAGDENTRGSCKNNFSQVFAGQAVGIKQVHDDIWLVSFMDYDLGCFDLELEPLENPFGPKVLPM